MHRHQFQCVGGFISILLWSSHTSQAVPVPIKLLHAHTDRAPLAGKADPCQPPCAKKQHAACLSVWTGQFSHGSPATDRLTVNLHISDLLGVSQTQFLDFFCSTRLQCFSTHSISPSVKGEIASLLYSAAEHTLPASFNLFSQINYWIFYLSGTIQSLTLLSHFQSPSKFYCFLFLFIHT